MDVQLKRYKKEFDHSYAFGVFPTLELLKYQPGSVIKVLLSSRGTRNEGVLKIEQECSRLGIKVEANDKLIERIAPKENVYAIGVFRKYSTPLSTTQNHVVLVSPSDMGNLGTILRTMAGFGIMNLALIKPAADIFDPKVVRSSMGALFQVSAQYFDSFEEYRNTFNHQLYPFMTDGAISLIKASFNAPYALVFGNESAGLPAQYNSIGTSVTIPQREVIDSLSLPIAVGIALYEATKGLHGRNEFASERSDARRE
jgi:TrmH family RNA methyltransferase